MLKILILAVFKLAALDNKVKNTTKKGYQPSSTKNLRSYINRYLDFCLEFKLSPIPAQGQQLRRFAQYLADSPTISAIQTINNYLWGLKTFHRLLGLPTPDTKEFLTGLMLKGLRLTLARPIKQAEPITPHILEKMFLKVDLKSEEQMVAWVAIIFGFHLLLRKSNLVPDTQREFDPEKQIARKDICMAINAVVVEIQWCKTLQFKEKVLTLPLVRLDNPVICPVYWAWRLVRRVRAGPMDPLFCYHRRGKYMVLTYPRLTYWFKLWIDQVGISSKGYTLHSCRRGGATYLQKANIPAQMIKILGNWASEAYLRYIDISLSKRVEASALFAQIVQED